MFSFLSQFLADGMSTYHLFCLVSVNVSFYRYVCEKTRYFVIDRSFGWSSYWGCRCWWYFIALFLENVFLAFKFSVIPIDGTLRIIIVCCCIPQEKIKINVLFWYCIINNWWFYIQWDRPWKVLDNYRDANKGTIGCIPCNFII